MARVATGSVIRQLGTLFEIGSVSGLSDRQLLELYSADRHGPSGEAAFAMLVSRHGPMVLGICRNVLGDIQHAEDAFQAVFLVLAQKAHLIRRPELLGNWLYGVTIRTARCARHGIKRRRKHEDGQATGRLEIISNHGVSRGTTQPSADWTLIAREEAEAIQDEIERLPQIFRRPVILCYFEGLTLEEAARRLRCRSGTIHSRLARAREKLRIRLSRRGVALPTTVLTGLLLPSSMSASMTPLLCQSTARFVTHFAAGQSGVHGTLSNRAAAFAQEVLRSMLIHKLRLITISVLVLGIVAIGTGFVAHTNVLGDEPIRAEAATPTAREPNRGEPENRRVGGRMTVAGRVLDPQGRPVPSARVMVYGASKQGTSQPGSDAPNSIGQATCDRLGQFRLEMPRITSSTHFMIGVAALAPGYGMGWVSLDVDSDQPSADIALRPEKVLVGRLFDVSGQPARGVQVSVEGIGYPQRGPEALPEEIDGPHFWNRSEKQPSAAWPAKATSDAQGRFTIRGIGKELRVLLIADDPRFARERLVIDTDTNDEPQSINGALEPAKVITGRVSFSDTGKPVPHASIEILAYRGGPGYSSVFMTDENGIFRANPFSTDRYDLAVYAPEGQPYLNATTGQFGWTKGAVEHRVDLVLRRGAEIHGKVEEKGSGRPVVGAELRYVVRQPPAAIEAGSWSGSVRSGPDGTYRLPILPGAGTLEILGPSEDYVLEEMGERMVREGKPGGSRLYAHAFITLDPKPNVASSEINVVLQRGTTVKARVLDTRGQPVREAWAFSRLLLQPQPVPWRRFSGEFHGEVHDGRFELHGLAPDTEVLVYFYDSKQQEGGTAHFSVKAAAEGPITVRLEPCAQAMARLVDPKGNPLTGYRDPYLISMIVTPGRDRLNRNEHVQGELAADSDYVSRIDMARYADLRSNAQGRITLPSLIPGATYRVHDMTTAEEAGGRKTRTMFIAGASQAIELGDVLIEKPKP